MNRLSKRALVAALLVLTACAVLLPSARRLGRWQTETAVLRGLSFGAKPVTLREVGAAQVLELLADELFGNYAGGDFIYELKVPLRRTEGHPHAIGAAPGAVVRLTLETPEIDVEALRNSMPAGDRDYRGGTNRDPMGGDAMGDDRMGGTMGGETMGGTAASGGRQFPDQLSIKARVRLAAP